ncbi:SGNH/GDSL hydrolase family protein [Labilithrix luteola]|nr:SGNH/GDSL hydrolase family protein [Labilithrix luteola]
MLRGRSMSLVRTAGSLLATSAVLLLASPACVIKLNDKNAPLDNGGVTGVSADCEVIVPAARAIVSDGPPAIKYVGRYDMSDAAGPKLDWSGSYVSARFTGTEVAININVPDNMDTSFMFEGVVDGQDLVDFMVSPGQTRYPIATNLPPGEHEVVVMRNTEPQKGVSQWAGFDFGPGGQLLPPTVNARRIEIIGDSITCGYGMMGPNATCPFDVEVRPNVRVPVTENVYRAYGSIAGRELSADVVTLCYSGKGVVLNYREPKEEQEPRTTMPQYYERTICGDPEGAKWDFTKDAQPQVVLINLGTNDFTRDVDADTVADGIDLPRFRAGYLDFVKSVRARRPDAHIFLGVSPMLTDKFPLDNARSEMRDTFGSVADELNAAGDTKVYRIEFVEQGTRYGLGCDYHPNQEVHRIMAEQLVGAIRSKTCW